MKLWRISQTVNDDYDTYSDAVVAADTRTEARHIHPSGTCRDYDTWALPEQVKVELLGTAKKGTKAGVICSSFHAG